MATFPNDTWSLLAKCISGNASTHEEQELLAQLKNNGELQSVYTMLLKIFEIPVQQKKADTSRLFARINRILLISYYQ
jgi:hypothetical protein